MATYGLIIVSVSMPTRLHSHVLKALNQLKSQFIFVYCTHNRFINPFFSYSFWQFCWSLLPLLWLCHMMNLLLVSLTVPTTSIRKIHKNSSSWRNSRSCSDKPAVVWRRTMSPRFRIEGINYQNHNLMFTMFTWLKPLKEIKINWNISWQKK